MNTQADDSQNTNHQILQVIRKLIEYYYLLLGQIEKSYQKEVTCETTYGILYSIGLLINGRVYVYLRQFTKVLQD